MQPVVLGTDVGWLSHKRKLPGPMAGRLIGRRPVITFVTFGELTKRVEVRQWGARSRQELADWISGIAILPGDESVAATWGVLSAAASRRGRPRPVNDMWIAACSQGAAVREPDRPWLMRHDDSHGRGDR